MDREALRMVFSPEFWRMGVLWTLSLLYSYLLLLLHGRTATYRRRRDVGGRDSGGGGRPICVVTGVGVNCPSTCVYYCLVSCAML
jgi:hypothetical protein